MARNSERKITKREYIKTIMEKYSGLERKFKEVAKMRKNHKDRINPAYTSGITSIKNLVGTYKRTSRAGQLKMTEKSLNQLTSNELRRLNRLLELQEQKKMYTELDKQTRKEAWDLAYTSFKNASKHLKEGTKAEDLVRRRRFMKKKDYRNMTYLFERMEGDLLHTYGSEVAETLYEERGGKSDPDTLYDVMMYGIDFGKMASAGLFGDDYMSKPNEVANDFVFFWSGYKSDYPKSTLDDARIAFYKDMTGDEDTDDDAILEILEDNYD